MDPAGPRGLGRLLRQGFVVSGSVVEGRRLVDDGFGFETDGLVEGERGLVVLGPGGGGPFQ